MNWFQRLFPRKFSSSTWFYPVRFNNFHNVDYYASYLSIPELNAVINLKVRAFSNMNIQGDQRVINLFQSPNWYQSGKEFLQQAKLQTEVFGNQYIYLLRPFGTSNIRALYVLPSEKVQVKSSDEPFYLQTEPQIRYFYNDTELPRENIIHYTSEKKAGDFTGISPLESLTVVINNLRLAYESRGIILRYRGALGILSNESKDGIGNPFPIDPKERDKIQEAYRSYGLNSDQYQIIITNQSLKWQQMTVDPDKIGLYDETREGFNKILDKFGVPADLFSRQQGSTYENQRQAERGFYIRTIIPEANEWIHGINTTLGTNLVASFEHLSVFSDDLKIKTEVLNSRINALSKLYQDQVIGIDEYRAEILKLL